MSHVYQALNCTEAEVLELKSLAYDENYDEQLKNRAHAILLLDNGKKVKEVSHILNVREKTARPGKIALLLNG